jgi:hypothetical protein
MRVFQSASKIVFVLIALTACLGFGFGILPVDQFMLLATGAFSYYFTRDTGERKNTL